MSIRDEGLRRARAATWMAHMEAERDRDLDKLMATITRNAPHWEVHPVAWWEGWDACYEVYRRAAESPEGFGTTQLFDELAGFHDPRVMNWGENHLMLEFSSDPIQYEFHHDTLSIIYFDGELIKGEHLYFTNPKWIEANRMGMASMGDIPGFTFYE